MQAVNRSPHRLHLQDLTRRDMFLYVEDEMRTAAVASGFNDDDGEAGNLSALAQRVTDKAQGSSSGST